MMNMMLFIRLIIRSYLQEKPDFLQMSPTEFYTETAVGSVDSKTFTFSEAGYDSVFISQIAVR